MIYERVEIHMIIGNSLQVNEKTDKKVYFMNMIYDGSLNENAFLSLCVSFIFKVSFLLASHVAWSSIRQNLEPLMTSIKI